DDPHAAAANLFEHLVFTDPLAGERSTVAEHEIGGNAPGWLVQETAGANMAFEKRLYFPEELGIAGRFLAEEGVARGRVTLERFVEQLIDQLSAGGVHACEFPSSSRASQAESTVQCRLTVAGEMCMASAV